MSRSPPALVPPPSPNYGSNHSPIPSPLNPVLHPKLSTLYSLPPRHTSPSSGSTSCSPSPTFPGCSS
ncbi:hypothetical protein GQ43DRAFT_445053 [Delitschia confertaspora ATCC 74209]|uniref:Uncharacterized protein n=1 Tax=Delitschia confertaspora ATCC 74209 TaxID=1513339 RepID=A0A9P4JGY1_9PLEO|nr:hypothetical protein GQ43DRAFT_445053 [Delitschia confertaspora ATCC 74209]